MKILIIGDIVGAPGREAVKVLVPKLKKEYGAEFVVANAENAAGGSGITPDIAKELFSYGIDVLTSGDHIWKKKEIEPVLDADPRLLRPANYPKGSPGFGAYAIKSRSGVDIGVVNLVGRVFMAAVDCPFKTAAEEIAQLKKKTKIILVDMHAEATSEKIALGWYLDGDASAVFGTHTHVQTADERILPKGTAFISDIGMCGPFDGVIGRRTEQIIQRFLTQLPVRFEMASENVQLHGIVVDVDENTGKAVSIQRVQKKL